MGGWCLNVLGGSLTRRDFLFSSTQYNTLTSVANLRTLFSRDKVKWPELTWLNIDELTAKPPAENPDLPSVAPAAVAFLQYTSGTCGEGHWDTGRMLRCWVFRGGATCPLNVCCGHWQVQGLPRFQKV